MLLELRRFYRDENAAVAMETVLITPLLVWAYVASFVFFDAYRVYNTSVKANYMVADWISRQTDPVYTHDIQGMADVAATIVRGGSNVQMRATQVGNVDGVYEVDWSEGVNGAPDLFTSNIPQIRHLLPDIANAERVVLIETFVEYNAPFDIGLTVANFDSFSVVRPRFGTNRVVCCWAGVPPP